MSTEPVPAEVENYFADLEPDQRAVLYPVIDTVRDAMPPGYALGMYWGMPGWVIPLETYPNTYNGRPLAYVSVAAQKNYNSLYLMGLYGDPAADAAFRAEWAATGRMLNMGKSCLRFKTLADVDLGIIARTVASIPVDRYLATYQRIRPASATAATRAATRDPAPGATATQ
ncbi:DUF1801 domain-containing protein [Cryobacterium fucosi]|uniref:DUF1801 domain-containing protein n=1 Tax=Cryobacterium fucosi TaxID=1259157 RepID=A0A4R9BBL0_9MICO|nr:DUF1801 domain-containing protein [Cryobacterium fucosi]TFD80187.1 DUF1801 domain-containing protein [Cryobacterium fucosi]